MCPSEPQPPPPPLDQPKVINTSALRVNLTPDNYHQDDENYKDEYTIQASGDPCKEISRTKTLFVNLGRRIFGKDAKPGESGILGILLRQERKRGGVHHFAPSTKLAIGYATLTKQLVMLTNQQKPLSCFVFTTI